MRTIPLLLLLFITICAGAQPKPAYTIYTSDGAEVTYGDLLSAALASEVLFFGELHNNPIAHWLQYELAMDLAADTLHSLAIGFEMFEADQQVLLDEYRTGKISTSSFEREARLWPNYKTDYKPIVEFGRKMGLPLIATNIPRRYASMVYSQGLGALDSLSDDAKRWMMPLPVTVDLDLPGYKNIMEAAQGHGGVNLPHSQAVKDATMAHFILRHKPEGGRLLHLNGAYHSNNNEGIVWYLLRDRPVTRVLTITTIELENILEPDADVLRNAHFTLVVNRTMTKTY